MASAVITHEGHDIIHFGKAQNPSKTCPRIFCTLKNVPFPPHLSSPASQISPSLSFSLLHFFIHQHNSAKGLRMQYHHQCLLIGY